MRHQHEPNDEQRRIVSVLASAGLPQVNIAAVLKIAPKTLRLHYRSELDEGSHTATAMVVMRLFQAAVDPDGPLAAAIFWLKTREGWSERGPGDLLGTGPQLSRNPDDYSDEQLRQLAGITDMDDDR